MSHIRLIAGRFGGRKIAAPPYDNARTHPMSERIRNAIFNSLGSRVRQAVVLDVFAGTGSVGFEALSRGASSVIFIESDRLAARIIDENRRALAVESSTKLIKTKFFNWFTSKKDEELYDIIFADPPYHDTQVGSVLKLETLLKPDGILILSWPEQHVTPQFDSLVVADQRAYAGAKIIYYQFAG